MNIEQHNEEYEINLSEILHVLLRHWFIIILTTIFTTGIAIAATIFLLKPTYEAHALLYNVNSKNSIASLADLQIGTQLSQDFIIIAKSKPVLDAAIVDIKKESNVTLTRLEIDKMVTVSNKHDTRILEIQAKSKDPKLAAVVANAVTKQAANQMAYIMNSEKPSTVEKAEPNLIPISPSKTKNGIIGVLLGFMLSSGIIILRFILNNNVVTPADIESLGLNNLAIVPINKDLE